MIHSVGIVGAGQMGSGIAYAFASKGYPVTLVDVSEDMLEKAKTYVAKTSEKRNESLIDISYSTSFSDLTSTDLIIEAVPENIDLKKMVFKEIQPYLKNSAILATNTSSISISDLAAGTNCPERFLGIHFMNPVPLMKLVEIIPGSKTDSAAILKIDDVIKKLDKVIVHSKDVPGFIVNRILMPMINEAIITLDQGVASAKDIDAAMKFGTNQPMGPLALADLIGLDTCLSIMQVLHNGLQDSKYAPCPLLERYVSEGRLGRKTKKGFYDYT
ncbi:MAG: 3-hydroxybutyryl-CoA dehydrogenase [Alphaproteobacteria bacterium]|jgi:3-hydroxybutyryl-CoA dehydrogenase|nr:3-hydroxybutyryl-CoA dehydrogenase [Alphaproteobacteria bacterium]MBT5389343.1 3-hydroxybutyryl-CoA dehydrogenase [Alphaproteobacteria bacterium]MBT5540405.1 3-hydroxybutyryl-CoA dehydrogenase [Alphaproteobacteria bacterium]MBT5654642.1 3-hydroxybutyryl-CoA dehydrogenase [Alphaproteobacteria bacterium]